MYIGEYIKERWLEARLAATSWIKMVNNEEVGLWYHVNIEQYNSSEKEEKYGCWRKRLEERNGTMR